VLVLAQLCADEGLFRACGVWMARSTAGRPRRLLIQVFAAASLITAVLSLDATVVLLTPVVFATAARLGARPTPHAYACAHLSNTASLLLPVSNLTNLLAFAASGLSFTRFAALMTLPWLGAIGVEYLILGRWFATDLDAGAQAPPGTSGTFCTSGTPDTSGTADAFGAVENLGTADVLGTADTSGTRAPDVPLFTLVVVGCTLAGFVLTSGAGVNPAWAALAGAVVLAARALAQRRTTAGAVLRSAGVPFLCFVLSLGIVVRAVVDNGLAGGLDHLVPNGSGLPELLAMAAVAALLANVINNLPAVLVLLPLAVPAGHGAVLAVLLGVNIGPNLTYAGSLATLLWRRILRDHGTDADLSEFTRLGLLTVPAALAVSVPALWAGLNIIGT
jgi:arsenical pump membrane protein